LVKNLHSAIEQKNFDGVGELLADNFVFEGPFPEPIGKQEFIGSHKDLMNAFDNFQYNYNDMAEDGNVVTGTIQISAKHTGTLDLTDQGGPVIEATNKDITLGKDDVTTTIENGKVTRVFSQPNPGGGMQGLVAALME
jgi:hypothetical protein